MDHYHAVDYDLTSILVERIPWRRAQWKANRYLPRLIASIEPDQLIELVPELIEVIDLVTSRHGYRADTKVWMNLYRNGRDYTPFHADNYDRDVVSVSFGCDRRFVVKGTTTREFTLKNGDVFVLRGDYPNTHAVPKDSSTRPRVSLVFFC